MSDLRAYMVHLHAQQLSSEMLQAHARGDAGSYNIMLGLEAFGKLHAAVHALTAAPKAASRTPSDTRDASYSGEADGGQPDPISQSEGVQL